MVVLLGDGVSLPVILSYIMEQMLWLENYSIRSIYRSVKFAFESFVERWAELNLGKQS